MTGSVFKRSLYGIYVAAVLALIAHAYPLSRAQPYADSEAMNWEFARPNGKSFLYRIDSQRTGRLDARAPAGNAPSLLRSQWNSGVHDASKASPVGDGTNIFVGNDGGRFGAFTSRGALLWEYFAPGSEHGIHSSAAIGGNYACFGTYAGRLVCLDRSDGHPLWMQKIGDAIGSSPLVAAGAIYVSAETLSPANGFVVALDLSNGKVRWRSQWLGDQAHASPAITEDGRLVIASANNHFLFAFRSDTGELAWKADLAGEAKGTPMIHSGVVYATSWAGFLYAFRAADGTMLWKAGLGGASQSSPTLLAGGDRILVAANGSVRVHRVLDGTLVASFPWTGDPALSRQPSALALRDSAWIGCGKTQLCRFSSDGARLLRRIELGGTVTGMPWWQQGSLFVSTTDPGGIYRID